MKGYLHKLLYYHLRPAVGIDFLILLCCSSSYLLEFLTVSSIERIVQAASVAALRAFTLSSKVYQTNEFLLSPTPLLGQSQHIYFHLPASSNLRCLFLNLLMRSTESKPALSEIVLGIIYKAFVNMFITSWNFNWMLFHSFWKLHLSSSSSHNYLSSSSSHNFVSLKASTHNHNGVMSDLSAYLMNPPLNIIDAGLVFI